MQGGKVISLAPLLKKKPRNLHKHIEFFMSHRSKFPLLTDRPGWRRGGEMMNMRTSALPGLASCLWAELSPVTRLPDVFGVAPALLSLPSTPGEAFGLL